MPAGINLQGQDLIIGTIIYDDGVNGILNSIYERL